MISISDATDAERTPVSAATLALVNAAVAKDKAMGGWQSHSSGSFVKEVLAQAEQTLRTYEEVSKPSAHALRTMIEQLRMARRIRIGVPLVPGQARLSMPATMQHHAFGLVYSTAQPLAIEYEHAGVYDAKADLTHALSTRRLALVVPMDSEFALDTRGLAGFEREPSDHGAVMVWSINHFEEKKEWEFAPTAAVIPRHQAIDFMKAQLGALTRAERVGRKLIDRLSELPGKWGSRNDRNAGHEGQSAASAQNNPTSPTAPAIAPIFVRHQDMLPELIRQLASDQLHKISLESSMDACWAALGTMNALACSNVELRVPENGEGAEECAERPMVIGPDAVPVDPFHGAAELDWKGNWCWRQGLRKGI